MEIETFLDAVRADPERRGRLIHVEVAAPRSPVFAEPAEPLPGALADALATAGIHGLYKHQAEAIDQLRDGSNVVVATSTASGKSLCYNAPVIEALTSGSGATALYLFPTKALAQDQIRGVSHLAINGVVPAAYDGDTPGSERSWIRRGANLIVTNPDMLHFGILPNHEKWASFFAGLRYVVLDELHMLRGVFGSHVANVIRRLRRVASHYGSDPVFAATTATIGNPDVLGAQVTGLPMTLIDNDGSPSGRRFFAIWDPPIVDPAQGRRASPHFETADLMADLVECDLRVIAFARSRRGAELVAKATGERLIANSHADLAKMVRSYRGGYLAEERREIERLLFADELRGIAATSALELGIDLGSLDACLLDCFPGTTASLRQQAGRAGRRLQDSLAVLVAGEDALDRWYVSHPEEVLSRLPESAVINPENPLILKTHLGCAAAELPLEREDIELFGDTTEEAVAEMVSDGDLRSRGKRIWWIRPSLPTSAVGLRSSGGSPFRIVDTKTGRMIGTEDADRVVASLHDGAVYMHAGELWVVDVLDLDDRSVWVEAFDGDYYTMSREETEIAVIRTEATRAVGGASMALGDVEVTTSITGYKTLSTGTATVTGYHDLALPPRTLKTRAIWLDVPEDLLKSANISSSRVTSAMHAIEHAGISVLPLFLVCDRSDIGGVSMAAHQDADGAVAFIYDGFAGGTGIAEMAFELGPLHLAATRDVIDSCRCDDGCPSCIQSPKCGNFNEHLDKAAASAVLREIVRDVTRSPGEVH